MAGFIYDSTTSKKQTSLLSQTFGWMTIGLLLTVTFSIGLAMLFNFLLANATTSGEQTSIMNTLLTLVGVASVLQFVLLLVIQFGVIRKGPSEKNITIPFLIYTANMGVILSSLVLFVAIDVLLSSLLITLILFATMTLFARQTRWNLSGAGIVGGSLFLGGFILMLVNFFLGSSSLEWMVSFILFGAIMLITLFDIWQVSKVSESGVSNRNLALFFAFNLYIDFIYIFIRIIYFIGLSRARN